MPQPAYQLALPTPLPQLFDYAPTAGHAPATEDIGRRMRVPFGPRELVGIVAGVAPVDAPPTPLREAIGFLDPMPVFSAELWASLHWLARYLHAPLGEVLATAMPAALRRGEPLPELSLPGWRMTEAGRTALPAMRAGKPRRLAEWLAAHDEITETSLDTEQAGWRAAMRTLRERGLVDAVRLPMPTHPTAQVTGPALNKEQQAAARAIREAADDYAPFLLSLIHI